MTERTERMREFLHRLANLMEEFGVEIMEGTEENCGWSGTMANGIEFEMNHGKVGEWGPREYFELPRYNTPEGIRESADEDL